MINITKHEDKLKCDQEIPLWFDNRELPESMYKHLSNYHKDLLRKIICKTGQYVSLLQKRELYNAFCSSMEFRVSNYKMSSEASDDYVRDFFVPLSKHDKEPKVEWGV